MAERLIEFYTSWPTEKLTEILTDINAGRAGHIKGAAGAAELLAVNVVCVNLAGVATFWVRRIVPARYWEATRARAATRTAVILWGGLLAGLVLYMLFRTERG